MAAAAEGNATLADASGVNSGFADGMARVRAEYSPRPYEIRQDSDAQASKFGELSRFVERKEEPAVQSLPLYNIVTAAQIAFNNATADWVRIDAAMTNALSLPGATAAFIGAVAANAATTPAMQAAVAAAIAAFPPGEDAKHAIVDINTATAQAKLKLATNITPQSLIFSAGPFQGQAIPEAGVLLMPTKEVVFTWHELPDRNIAVWDGAMGTVNTDTFDGAATGYPSHAPGTLLFLTYRDERSTNAAGRVQWRVEFRFAKRPGGWNFYPAPDGHLYPATWGGAANGQTVYLGSTFQNLFTLPAPPQTYWPLTG